MQKVILIGATSGIGKALALAYLEQGNTVGITGRREENLKEIANQFPETCFMQCFDINAENSEKQLLTLAQRMGSVDIIIINSGVGNWNPKNELQPDLTTIQTNVLGFSKMTLTAFQIFLKQGFGHIVGISSIASYFGYGKSAAYNASKAFDSNYLSGIAHRAKLSKKKIYVTDVQPGFIQTPLIEKRKEVKWAISAEKMAQILIPKLDSHPSKIIIPARWIFVSWLLRLIPDSMIHRFS